MLSDDIQAFIDDLHTRKNAWEFVLQRTPDNDHARRELSVLRIVIPAVEEAATPYKVIHDLCHHP